MPGKKIFLLFLIIFTAILIYLVICHKIDIDFLQKIFSIIGSLSLGIALATYITNRKKDTDTAAIDQISFFRREIMQASREVIGLIKKQNGQDYKFTRIKLDTATVEFARKNFSEESKKQAELLKYAEIVSAQSSVLNAMEELAVKIIHFGTIDHKALGSIRTTFIELVEVFAVTLLTQREILSGTDTYSSVLAVYREWKDGIDRRSPEQRHKELLEKISKN